MVSISLRPPGWNRKPLKSERRKPLRSRKSCNAGASALRISEGSSGLSTTPKPSSLISQPMMRSVCGQQHSPMARMRGPPLAPSAVLRNSTPAAPSPNKAVDTNIAGLGSLTRRHRLHRSTVRNSTCAPSVACASRVARARPATPPPQPRPKIGSRSTVGLSLRRLNSLASRLGIASPVIVLVTRMSISASSTPAAAVALSVTSAKRSSACF
jgi:hypothetical protein